MDGWKFLSLVQSLRQVSIPVSSQDILEALFCLNHFSCLSEKKIIKSLVIHRPQDVEVFDAVWKIVIEEPENNAKELRKTIEDKSSPDASDTSQAFGGQGTGRGFGGITLTSMKTGQEIDSFINTISTLQLEYFVNREKEFEDAIKTMLADLNYYTWINSYDLAYQRRTLNEDEWQIHQNHRINIVNALRQRFLSSLVLRENSWEPVVRQHWLYKPLSNLTESEKILVKSSIQKWARKLALKPGMRWKASSRGSIDISKILKQSVQWDGALFRLSYRQKTLQAPELIVLCDISNSMAAFVEFLIYLVNCLRARFKKIRVFFFIDCVWEVSNSLKNNDYLEIKQEIISWGHKISSGYSDYGAVFKEIAEKYLSEFSSNGTVLILGDGKNNYRLPQTEYLVRILEKERYIFWLNPLEIEEWNEPDNMMREYQAYCTHVYRCSSASDLEIIVKNVF
jgi:uncharacterized protein with von Willebrand factor type A (vWA) domain